ncbi:MAG: monovalent cation/H+ antiporter complex subunit F [Verrucomicrobiales bacterium]
MVWPILVSSIFILFSLAMGIRRLMIGPRLPDRVIALDLVGLVIASLLILAIFITDTLTLLDVVLVLAIIQFFGTIAFARYIEGRSPDDDE